MARLSKKAWTTTVPLAIIGLDLLALWFGNDDEHVKIILALGAFCAVVALFLGKIFRGGFGEDFLPLFAGTFTLGFLYPAISHFTSDKRDYLMLDNRSATGVRVTLDGATVAEIPAGSTMTVHPTRGSHKLVVTTLDGTSVEDASIDFRRHGFLTLAKAIYSIGADARYAAVRFDYANQSHQSIRELVAESPRLFAIKGSFSTDPPVLDDSFPASIQVNKNDATWRENLCHYYGDQSHGCR